MPEYTVDLFSESYGSLSKEDTEGMYACEWSVPFGINNNGKLVFWLGDINDMDDMSKNLLKPFNIASDHNLISSEFYQAQMNCIFSKPIKEKQIIVYKDMFINNIMEKYSIDLRHLENECSKQIKIIQRPIVFNETNVSSIINAFDKVLVEGISVTELIHLYEKMYLEDERNNNYKDWKSIKLIEAILIKLSEKADLVNSIDIKSIISPLYILHDYRILLDHLLSSDKQKATQKHIIDTLNISDFSNQEEIYLKEIDGLKELFQILALLSN